MLLQLTRETKHLNRTIQIKELLLKRNKIWIVTVGRKRWQWKEITRLTTDWTVTMLVSYIRQYLYFILLIWSSQDTSHWFPDWCTGFNWLKLRHILHQTTWFMEQKMVHIFDFKTSILPVTLIFPISCHLTKWDPIQYTKSALYDSSHKLQFSCRNLQAALLSYILTTEV